MPLDLHTARRAHPAPVDFLEHFLTESIGPIVQVITESNDILMTLENTFSGGSYRSLLPAQVCANIPSGVHGDSETDWPNWSWDPTECVLT
eukprot:scaffold85848_cov30-Tisochrysis_lutea.AAC.3